MYIKEIPQTDENIWLQQGCCEFLVNELYEEFGYGAKVLVFVDNNTEFCTNDELLNLSIAGYINYGLYDDSVDFVHAFSYANVNGKTYYIDSTGITDNINDILGHFHNMNEAKIDGDHCRLLDFQDPRDIQGNFWSTYYDEDEKENEGKTEYAREFMRENKEKLDVRKVIRERNKRKEKETER